MLKPIKIEEKGINSKYQYFVYYVMRQLWYKTMDLHINSQVFGEWYVTLSTKRAGVLDEVRKQVKSAYQTKNKI